MAPSPLNTRRWPRKPVDLQVLVVLRDGESKVFVPGRLTEISKGGLALCAGINLQPGDPIEVELPSPYSRVKGTDSQPGRLLLWRGIPDFALDGGPAGQPQSGDLPAAA